MAPSSGDTIHRDARGDEPEDLGGTVLEAPCHDGKVLTSWFENLCDLFRDSSLFAGKKRLLCKPRTTPISGHCNNNAFVLQVDN